MVRAPNRRPPEGRAAGGDLEADLARIVTLDRVDLDRFWRDLTGTRPPDGLPKGLLQRLSAHKLQEARLGGLDRATERALISVARGRLEPERRIIEAIASGAAPPGITVSALTDGPPLSWAEQEQRFGIA